MLVADIVDGFFDFLWCPCIMLESLCLTLKVLSSCLPYVLDGELFFSSLFPMQVRKACTEAMVEMSKAVGAEVGCVCIGSKLGLRNLAQIAQGNQRFK